jgi:hypothetical protein
MTVDGTAPLFLTERKPFLEVIVRTTGCDLIPTFLEERVAMREFVEVMDTFFWKEIDYHNYFRAICDKNRDVGFVGGRETSSVICHFQGMT